MVRRRAEPGARVQGIAGPAPVAPARAICLAREDADATVTERSARRRASRLRPEADVVSHYQIVAQQQGSVDALALADQLAAWHDRMVTHRRALAAAIGRRCDDACPHAEAVELWRAAVETLGDAADRLAFLKATAAAALAPRDG
jgi:hypothetical protein